MVFTIMFNLIIFSGIVHLASSESLQCGSSIPIQFMDGIRNECGPLSAMYAKAECDKVPHRYTNLLMRTLMVEQAIFQAEFMRSLSPRNQIINARYECQMHHITSKDDDPPLADDCEDL